MLTFALLSNFSLAQDDAILIIVPNQNSSIILDGVHQGTAKANAAFRINTGHGEHYIEAEARVEGISLSKGEIVVLESGKQKIVKLDFESSNQTSFPGDFMPVAELNFTLPGVTGVAAWMNEHPEKMYPYPEFYFAFEEGDEIKLDISMSNLNGTNLISVSTYPDGVERYSNRAFVEMKDFVIKIPKRSIYRFMFATNHVFQRNAFLIIARKPKTNESLSFNTKVEFKRILTAASVMEVSEFFINSGSNATFMGGKSRVVVPVKLPTNTVEWFYRFSAFRDKNAVTSVKSNFDLLGEVTQQLLKMSDLGLGITSLAVDVFTKPPGSDYCDVYLLTHEYVASFESKTEQWKSFSEGTRANFKSGNVMVTCCNTGMYYLGIKNPDTSYGINVVLEIVAITAKDEYVMSLN